MIGKTLLLIGSVGLLAAPAPATAESKTTVCHRTGAPARTPGLFQGQIIEIATVAVPTHIDEHGDVAIDRKLRSRFAGRVCQTDGAGGLFDANGNPVQAKPNEETDHSGGPIEEPTPS